MIVTYEELEQLLAKINKKITNKSPHLLLDSELLLVFNSLVKISWILHPEKFIDKIQKQGIHKLLYQFDILYALNEQRKFEINPIKINVFKTRNKSVRNVIKHINSNLPQIESKMEFKDNLTKFVEELLEKTRKNMTPSILKFGVRKFNCFFATFLTFYEYFLENVDKLNLLQISFFCYIHFEFELEYEIIDALETKIKHELHGNNSLFEFLLIYFAFEYLEFIKELYNFYDVLTLIDDLLDLRDSNLDEFDFETSLSHLKSAFQLKSASIKDEINNRVLDSDLSSLISNILAKI